MAKPRFKCLAGGLDVAAKTLAELQEKEAPPEDPPCQLREFLEREGYTVRHKLSQAEIAACNKSSEVKWITLQADAMEKLYRRHRAMVLAAGKMLNIARSWPHALPAMEAEVAMYWWHDEQGCEQLSDNSAMGLRTAVQTAGLQPVFYGYRKPSNLPSGVEYKDATEVLTLEQFTEHRKHYPHAVIADLARLRGMKKAVDAGATYVWFVDLDTLWCQNVTAACSLLPAAAFEHVVGTMQGLRSSRAGTFKSIEKGMTEFLRAPFDYQYAATPLRMTRHSPLLPALLMEMENMMATCSCTENYMAFMQLLTHKVRECGLLGAYQDPAAFSGVNHWTRRSCLTKESIQTLSKGLKKTVCADDILRNAIGINTYWQTGKNSDESLCERGSDAHVGQGSLWASVLQKLNATMASAGSHDDMPAACSQNADRLPTRRRLRSKVCDPCATVPDPLPWSAVEQPPDSYVGAFRNAPTARPAHMDWEMSNIKRRCTLIRSLGEGTYGRVYVGKYTGDACHVAVKISKAEHLHKPITATEIALLTRLQSHENVVYLRDFFFSPYFSVMVLQALDIDLWHVLHRLSDSGGLQPAVATRITGLVARGAAHVHSKNIIHRDMHAGNILLSFAGGLQAAIEGGLQPATVVDRVCIADFGQGCDTLGSKRFEERSVGVGALAITPPECYLAMKGLIKKKAMYDSAVDVWAIGVNLLMMIAGSQKMVAFSRTADYLGFWIAIIGKVPATVSKRMGWVLEQWALRDDRQQCGLQPDAALQPVAWASRPRVSMSREQTSMCSLHRTILEYDHTQRPLSRDIHRRCEELTRLAASPSGNGLAAGGEV